MLRRLRHLLKFENHIFRDASGAPWMGMDEWANVRHPTPPSKGPGFISRSAMAVNLAFVDMRGNVIRVKADQGDNLAMVAEQAGVNINVTVGRELVEHPYSHMIVSSPHCERLVPPDPTEDEFLARLEMANTIHRNSRFIKFLWVNAAMEGMVIVHPLQADVWTANQASPFTGQVESRDVAVAPNLSSSVISAEQAIVPSFPSVWECLRAGISTYPELWDYTRARFLAMEQKRKAWKRGAQ